ncbi:hypothetical protein DFH11DRAFT_1690034 [Phellopilus nigrolimitatus]|nr:hypothetical protein DFH11DRAFT_1690034 [Phellopilus nigrolimitatus]
MPGVREVSAGVLISAYAAHLERSGKLEVSRWVDIVKTGHFKDMTLIGTTRMPVGIDALTKLHGGRNHCGNRLNHHADASASVQRKVCQSLKKIGVLELSDNGGAFTRASARARRSPQEADGEVEPEVPSSESVDAHKLENEK